MQPPASLNGFGPAPGNAPMQAGRAGHIDSDFQTFLQMLTTQMKHQDPLNPMEATDFAVQLATFSGVEQQVRTNQHLAQLTSEQGMSDLAGWVGMEARAPAGGYYDESPVRIGVPGYGDEHELELVVRDENGNEVDRSLVPRDSDILTWPDPEDTEMPSGSYDFSFDVYTDDELIDSLQAEVYSKVVEARLEGRQTVLVLEGGGMVPAEQVSALRAPD